MGLCTCRIAALRKTAGVQPVHTAPNVTLHDFSNNIVALTGACWYCTWCPAGCTCTKYETCWSFLILVLVHVSSPQAAAIARSSTLGRLGPMALRVMRAGLTAARIAAKAAAAANAAAATYTTAAAASTSTAPAANTACEGSVSDELLKELQAAMQGTKQTTKTRKEVGQLPAHALAKRTVCMAMTEQLCGPGLAPTHEACKIRAVLNLRCVQPYTSMGALFATISRLAHPAGYTHTVSAYACTP